jgi:nucleoside-diphosphate-sugar epimerase
MTLLFGANGLIGQALARRLPDAKAVHTRDYREALQGFSGDIVFANGLTDPKASREKLMEANLEFPERVLEMTNGRGCRYLTLGTVQEHFPALCEGNAYYESKVKLAELVATQPAEKFTHLRLHTIYGARFKSSMFLGQMKDALAAGKPFQMSSGDQLREYHHADDVAGSIAALLSRKWEERFRDLSSGKPVKLAELAKAVFHAFGKDELLEIGALSRAGGENTGKVFARSPDWLLGSSREPVAGVIAELKTALWRP